MRTASFQLRLLTSAAVLLGAACSPSEEVFGNASSSGGGSGTGDTGATTGDGGSSPQSSGGGEGAGSDGGAAPTSSTGQGAGGSKPDCDDAGDCDDPEGECAIAACVQGACGEAFVPQGAPTVEQNVGDCRTIVCDGNGGTESADDDGDLVDDDNDCTVERCEAGELVIQNADEGTDCGDGGNLTCNDAGECVGCNAPSQCSGEDDDCQTVTCDDGVCGFDYEAEGTPVDDEPGNCVVTQCDGDGNVATIVDDGDEPEDGIECTRDVCNDGTPANPPRDQGDPCGNGDVCDGDGACVGCVEDEDCGDDTACAVYACNSGSCDVLYADPGDFAGDPVADDCLHDDCGAQGALVEDVPDDAGESCGDGNVCDGAGNCSECSADDDCNSDACRCGACVDDAWIFFSQYVEGSGNNKGLEIYNATSDDFDLEDFECEIQRYQNGGQNPVVLPLTGVIAPGRTWVVCNSTAAFALSCDQTGLTAMDFNGNDAVALACFGEIFDVIGEIGFDPGTQWGNGNASTEDNTLYRKPRIFVGDPDGGDDFTPSVEWNGAGNNVVDGLGEHDPCDG